MSQNTTSDHLPAVTPGDCSEDASDPRSRERREALNDFWVAVKRLPAYTRLAAALARDSRIPYRARAVLLVGGAYMVSPVDLVPGVIPVAGQLDDMYVVLMAIRQTLRMAPVEFAEEHLDAHQLELHTIDSDLAAIRRLVRIGVSDGARWGWKQLDQLGNRIGSFMARHRGEQQ